RGRRPHPGPRAGGAGAGHAGGVRVRARPAHHRLARHRDEAGRTDGGPAGRQRARGPEDPGRGLSTAAAGGGETDRRAGEGGGPDREAAADAGRLLQGDRRGERTWPIATRGPAAETATGRRRWTKRWHGPASPRARWVTSPPRPARSRTP